MNQQKEIDFVKKNGIKTIGTIIENYDGDNIKHDRDKLGGNFNSPVIKFKTNDGKEIIGEPVVGFVTQFELTVPCEIGIIYNNKNPEEFCIDADYSLI